MKLTDFDKKQVARKALQETYKISFDVSKLSKIDTQKMLQKVRKLTMEAKSVPDFYKNQTSPAYMKLVFMEQALVSHYNQIKNKKVARIVLENEAVEEAQVVLAAQDMVNTIQKMLEDIGQMQVKELPALVDSIESEIGVNEASSYNEQVTAQLDTLTTTLKEAFKAMKAARDSLTPQGGSFSEPAGMEAGAEMGAEMGAEADAATGAEMGAEMGAEAGAATGAEMGAEAGAAPEPTAEPVTGVGREKR